MPATTDLHAETFDEKVHRHQMLLRARTRPVAALGVVRFARAAERMLPVGQAREWYADAFFNMPQSGRDVAMQIARLCGDDSMVTLPQRSLADAVGKADKAGRTRAYAERGVEVLVAAGWLRVEATGRGCRARTAYYLLPGTSADRWSSGCDEGDPARRPAAA
jgi:hypothetical protein